MAKLLKKCARKTKSSSPQNRSNASTSSATEKPKAGAHLKDLLGGKGANLADMTLVPLPVPPGFTITTETCGEYNDLGQKLPKGLMDEVKANICSSVEKATGKKFGDPNNPLLVAVRSGAKMSMPGMMDTVLNIGLNDAVVEGMAELTGNERFAYDSYRRLINMFGDTVMGVDHHHFEHELSAVKNARGVQLDTELDTDGLKEVVERYKKVYHQHRRRRFPAGSARAAGARHRSGLQELDGRPGHQISRAERHPRPARHGRQRAVRWSSATWAMTAPPASRSRAIPPPARTDFTANSSSTPRAKTSSPASARRWIARAKWASGPQKSWKELLKIKDMLEKRYKDVQDFEFTIEKGKLYMLQTRNGKRTAAAAVQIAVEMVKEKLIDEKTAVLRVDPA